MSIAITTGAVSWKQRVFLQSRRRNRFVGLDEKGSNRSKRMVALYSLC